MNLRHRPAALSRRQLLVGGTAVVGGSLLSPHRAFAAAPWLITGGTAALAPIVTWLLKKAYNWSESQTSQWMNGVSIGPGLMSGSFHAKWCDFSIGKELSRFYSVPLNASIEIKARLLRLNRDDTDIPEHKDLNSIELKKIQSEGMVHQGFVYTPCNYRQAYNPDDGDTRRMFKELCHRRTLERVDEPHRPMEDVEKALTASGGGQHTARLCYTRPMNDGQGNQHTGFMYQLRVGNMLEYRFEIMT